MTHSQHGFLLSRQSIDTAQGIQIILWLLTPDGPYKLLIENEKGLFFVATRDAQRLTQLFSNQTNIDSKPLPLKDFNHEPVSAFYCNTLNTFYQACDIAKAHDIEIYEADIRLHDRYLMERFCHAGIEFIGDIQPQKGYKIVTNPRIKPSDYKPVLSTLSLDIECNIDGVLYSVGLQNENIKRVIMIGSPQPSDDWITWVENEKALLQQMVSAINDIDPDIIIGWNVINFDFRLLHQRAHLNRVPLSIGRDGSTLRWRDSRQAEKQGFVTIAGRVVIDGIDSLKTATYQFDSFSLENVAQHLLGIGKQAENVQNRLAEIQHNFLHNKIKLAEYNLQDCVLVTDIFKTTKLLDFLQLRSQLTGLELDRSGGSVAAFTHLYLPKLHRAGFIAPNLPKDGGLASPGGYVMSSKPGLYKNVLVFDFKSLYPSIIRTFKIDPLGLILGLHNPTDAIPGFKGAMFSRDQHFLPEIIEQLWKQRDQAKKDQDDARSQAIKILMNSFYGVLGSGGCRFYDTRLASSITLRGHEIMQQTARWIEDLGYSVIYGDTDSTFVLLPSDCAPQQANQIGVAIQDQINKKWHAHLNHTFNLACELELEFETHYQRFLMPTIRGTEVGSKKRYAGLIKQGEKEKLVFKGLETVRSDWTQLARDFQTELYHRIFHDEDVVELVKSTVSRTLSGDYDQRLVYRKRLRRPLAHYVKNVPPHVKAARLADEQNKQRGLPLQYQDKGRIDYVITLSGPEPVEYRSSPLDYQHYVDAQIKPVADAILGFIDLNFDELINKQMSLF